MIHNNKTQNEHKKYHHCSSCTASLALSLTAGAQAQFTPTEVNALRKLQMAEYAINNLYVDSVNMGDLTENAIRGMLNSLDPHSRLPNRPSR